MAGIGSTVILVPGVGKFLFTSFRHAVAKVIKNELRFLNLDQDGIEKFASDFSMLKDDDYKLAIREYSLFGIGSSTSGKVHQLVSIYLLSTDFFLNNMDERRLIKYMGLFDPYTRACAHPFSYVYFPS